MRREHPANTLYPPVYKSRVNTINFSSKQNDDCHTQLLTLTPKKFRLKFSSFCFSQGQIKRLWTQIRLYYPGYIAWHNACDLQHVLLAYSRHTWSMRKRTSQRPKTTWCWSAPFSRKPPLCHDLSWTPSLHNPPPIFSRWDLSGSIS